MTSIELDKSKENKNAYYVESLSREEQRQMLFRIRDFGLARCF